MKHNDYIEVSGTEQGTDFDGRYSIERYNGVAFYLLGWAIKYEPVLYLEEDEDGNEIDVECGEYDEVADYGKVIAVMVGDDHHFTIDPEDLRPLSKEDYCPECGQIGCTAYASTLEEA